MRWLADFVYLLAGLAYLPIALYQMLIVGKNRRGWAERFGGVRTFDHARPRIWVHAVSLGEINCTPRLV
ncbi:MAG: glycosyltransferase N-terminal domain-containing protein, partial [Planctomycetota bacterium]